MAVMDEFKEERKSIKNAPFKKKVEYFFDYYKWHTIITIVILVAILAFANDMMSKKDTVLYAAIINSYSETEYIENLQSEFGERIGMDSKTEEVTIDNIYYLDYVDSSGDHATYLQKLITLAMTNLIDNIATDDYTFARLAYLDMFLELEDYLSVEEIEAYESAGRVLYIDQDLIDEINAMDYSSDLDSYIDYLYGNDTSVMGNPKAVGIIATEDTTLQENFEFTGDCVVIGIVSSTVQFENAVEFFDYMLE